MTHHDHVHSEHDGSTFTELMAVVMSKADRFGHREHIHLTWLAVQRYGVRVATTVVSDGIQRTARYAGAPQKYHVTMSRAWVELVGHHVLAEAGGSFDSFAALHAELFDKRLLARFYTSATLACASARSWWVEPDLAPFPWRTTAS